jgi:hypothetical protein
MLIGRQVIWHNLEGKVETLRMIQAKFDSNICFFIPYIFFFKYRILQLQKGQQLWTMEQQKLLKQQKTNINLVMEYKLDY